MKDPHFTDREMNEALTQTNESTEPSAVHFNSLRLKLRQEAYAQNVGSTRGFNSRLRQFDVLSSTATKWLAVAATILVLSFASRIYIGTANASLKSTLNATRRSGWIHSSTIVVHSNDTQLFESWCAPAQRLAAFRSKHMLHFINYEEGTQASYTDKSKSIYCWRADMNSEEIGRTFINALLTNGDLSQSYPWHTLSDVKRTLIEVAGEKKTKYSFQLKFKSNPEIRSETIVQADPKTGLIESWEEIHANGTRVRTDFDYPATGPRDIYELGASRDAAIVDRIASSDVVALGNKFQEQVYNFDDYQAIVIDRSMDDYGLPSGEPLLRLIRRDGKRFSVELLQPVSSEFRIPDTLDWSWWEENQLSFIQRPLATCDGETCTLVPLENETLQGEAEFPHLREPTTIPVMAVNRESGLTTTVPVWPSLWPEYACRPFMMTTDPTVRIEIDAAGTDGPPETLRVRLLTPDHPLSTERASYWIAIDGHRCVLKSVHASSAIGETSVNEFLNFHTSPRGIDFATVRISHSPGRQRKQRTYVVNFGRK